MHAGFVLLSWLGILAAFQLLRGGKVLIGALLLVALAWILAPANLARLVFRSRWLFLMLLGIYGWQTPGLDLMAGVSAGISREGALLAVEESARLLGTVAWVAVLLGRLPLPSLLAGLLWLQEKVAVNVELARRTSLRLALLLQYLQAPVSRDQWLQWLGDEGEVKVAASVWFKQLSVRAARDWCALVLSFACLAAAWGWGRIE